MLDADEATATASSHPSRTGPPAPSGGVRDGRKGCATSAACAIFAGALVAIKDISFGHPRGFEIPGDHSGRNGARKSSMGPQRHCRDLYNPQDGRCEVI